MNLLQKLIVAKSSLQTGFYCNFNIAPHAADTYEVTQTTVTYEVINMLPDMATL